MECHFDIPLFFCIFALLLKKWYIKIMAKNNSNLLEICPRKHTRFSGWMNWTLIFDFQYIF